MTAPDDRVARWLSDAGLVGGGAHHPLLQALRAAVLSLDATVSEEVKYGGLLYSAGAPFCGLFCYSAHVSLEFSQGARLPDPGGCLLGDGKFRRHLKFKDLEDVSMPVVVALLRAAHALAREQEGG